ncbi:uncharacterized protein [Hoplias malabaricus]
MTLWILFLLLCLHHVSGEDIVQLVLQVGTVVLLEPNRIIPVSERPDVRWKWNDILLKAVMGNQQYKNKYSLLPNGTLQINHGSKSDSGNYHLEIFDIQGKRFTHQQWKLTFVEPVSVLRVWRSCSGHQNITVKCAVESGDNVRFMWKFKGTEWKVEPPETSGEPMVLLQFDGEPPGDLVCEAFNNVSFVRAAASHCRDYFPTAASSVLFLVISIWIGTMIFIRTFSKNNSPAVEENIYLDMRGVTEQRNSPQLSRTTTMEDPNYDVYRVLQNNPSSSLSSQSPNFDDVYVL